jgi:hypothetical protein
VTPSFYISAAKRKYITLFKEWGTKVAAEISGFVTDLALPYLREHEEMRTIRRTLLEKPGHAQNLKPYRQILTIDRVLGEEPQAKEDLATLETRYAGFHDGFRREFHAFRDRFLSGEIGG